MALESDTRRVMRFSRDLTIEKELLDASYYSLNDTFRRNQAALVILRASRKSCGGMRYKRNRTLFEDADGGQI